MNFWQKTRRFFGPAFKNPSLYIITSGFSSLLGSATGYIQIYMIDLFTDIFARSALDEFWPKIWLLLIFFTINIVLLFIMRNFIWIYPQFNMEFDVLKIYFEKYFKGDNVALEKIGTGRMIDILSTGAQHWTTLINEGLNNILRWIFLINLSGYLISRINGWYSIGIPLLFMIVLINSVYFTNLALHWRKKRKEVSVEKSRMATRMIMSKFEVLQNHRIDDEIRNLRHNINKSIELSKKSHIYSMGSWQLSRFIIACFTGYICIQFFYRAQIEGISTQLVAEIGVVTGLMATFMSYFNLLIEWYTNFTKEFVHVEKLWDTFDDLKTIDNYDIGDSFKCRKGDYEARGLFFSYTPVIPVLSDFSLQIQGGKRTAIVGRSGSGKTTLMKLLAGYMRPTAGKLLIDGQNITEIRLDSYYPHIGYLTQEPSVFDGTIEENLLYGMSEKKKKSNNSPLDFHQKIRGGKTGKGKMGVSSYGINEKIKQAIELSECHFIYELEDGIKTEIGERGIRLSGGQKQRLAIAKIFLKDPEIILLDEPTAALDSYSEEKVAKAFEHLFEGRTVIVIAHRLQTVKSADDIIVLEKGKIVERGTHKELLKLGKKYAGMVDLQSGVVREEDEESLTQN